MSMQVRRGPQSWAFIYIALGFVVNLETSAIFSLDYPWAARLIITIVVSTMTWALFTRSGWFINKLLSLKFRLENKQF